MFVQTFNQITNSILILDSLMGTLTKSKWTQKSYGANHQLICFPLFLMYCSIYKRYNYFTCFAEVSAETNASQSVSQKPLDVGSGTSSLPLTSRIRNLFRKKDTEKSARNLKSAQRKDTENPAGKRKTSGKCNSSEKTQNGPLPTDVPLEGQQSCKCFMRFKSTPGFSVWGHTFAHSFLFCLKWINLMTWNSGFTVGVLKRSLRFCEIAKSL